MSTEIDNRVVSMQFDNKHFEKNVQTSVSTLEKLKQSLNLSGAAKGLESINSAANGINLSPIGRGVDAVQTKFSALQVMAVTALANITNSAVNAGKKIASALTVEPIKTGFQEYETQIGAVQTILANTQSKGKTLEDVNGALDELNTYADKTIYNFTEMTRNIGTFTAAGVDLDKSVTSIKGIANLAAVSGSTSQQASTAMYQLSQALAAGKVQLMDWNSVVNAGMGGQVFQDALKRTATHMGTNVDAMIKKYGSFRESLTKGNWLTAEVLTETLTQLSGAYSEADLIAQGYSEKQAKEIVDLSETAVNAATKVKTFTQLFDTLKEAAQSGWTQTWELIVGDFEEAKALFSEVSETLGGIIGKSAESRNDLLKGALASNWDKLTEKINGAGIETTTFENQIKKTAKAHKVDVDALIKKHGSLKNAIKEGAISTDILNKSVAELGKKLPNLDAITKKLEMGDKGKGVKELQKALKTLNFDVGKTGADGVFGKKTQDAVKAFQKANKLKVTGIVDDKTLAALEKATTSADELNGSVKGLIKNVTELGGRELLIDSLRNAFKAICAVVKPIKEAFNEIFPPATSKQLLDVIKGFHSFTEKLIINEEQQKKLKTTFKGVFSIIDIGVTVIKEIIGGIVELIGKFSGLGDGVLDTGKKFGDWATGLRKSVKESDMFGKAVDKVVGILSKAIDGIKAFASVIKEKIVAPGFEGFINLMSGLWKVIQTVGSKVASVAGEIGTVLGEAFRSGDMVAGLDVINAALGTGILLNLKKFVGGLAEQFGSGMGLIDNIKETFGAVRDSLSSLQDSLKAKTLQELSKAIAILAASILVLSLIKPEKLAASLGAITALFADLMASLTITGNIGGDFKTITKAVVAMKGIAVAVLILAAALKVVSTIEPERLMSSLIGIIVLMATVVKAIESTSKIQGKAIKGAGGIILFAVGIKVLASAVKDLSTLSLPELAKGLIGVGILIAGLTAAMNKMPSGKGMTSIGVSMILMGAAMKIFASAVSDLGNMKLENLAQGVIAMGVSLAIITAVMNKMPNSKGLISTSIAMILVGAAIKIFASAVSDLGNMKLENLVQGLVGMGVALYGIVGAMHLMPKNMLASSIGLVIVAGSLAIIANVLSNLGGMSWDEIGRGLAALGGSLIILAGGLYFMKNSIVGAAAMIVAAGAIAILAPALALLGGLSWEEIGRGLVAIAGSIAIFAIAAAILTATGLIGGMVALAGVIVLVGAGCLAAGAGISLMAMGITLLATSLATGATAIVAGLTVIVTGLIALIPAVAAKIGEGLIVIFKVLIAAVPMFCQAVMVIATAVLLTLNVVVPLAVNVILNLLTSILESIANYLPRILQAGMDIILALLRGIRDNIGEIVTTAIEIIAEFINGIAGGIPDVIDAGVNLIISFIEGVAGAIDKNTDRLISAIRKLFVAVLRAAVKILTGGIVDIKEVGQKIMKSGFIKGVKDKFSDVKKTIKELPGKMKACLKEKISDLRSAGKDLMNGFVKGIKDKMSAVGEAASSAGKKAYSSLKSWLKINSPAKRVIPLGTGFDEGLIVGIKKFAGKVSSAASNVGSVAFNGIKGAMSRVSDLANSDINSQPTIRPVLDLSDVSAGADAINGMFAMNPSVGVMSNIGAISSLMNGRQNGVNDDVVSAINKLGKTLGGLSGDTYNVNGITYDDGSNIASAVQTLVGAARRGRRV